MKRANGLIPPLPRLIPSLDPKKLLRTIGRLCQGCRQSRRRSHPVQLTLDGEDVRCDGAVAQLRGAWYRWENDLGPYDEHTGGTACHEQRAAHAPTLEEAHPSIALLRQSSPTTGWTTRRNLLEKRHESKGQIPFDSGRTLD